MTTNSLLLNVTELKKHHYKSSGLFAKKQVIKSVDGISFTMKPGRILGIIGESGSGKTSLALMLAGLSTPTSGSVIFNGINVHKPKKTELPILRKEIRMVFQDPFSSLNPRKNILSNLGDILLRKRIVKNKEEQLLFVTEALNKVGLPDSVLYMYPHQLSGGQQQRLSIGRAIIGKPKLIICDEIVSALDLSMQAQILNMLKDLYSSMGINYLFISHDLAVVRHFCSDIIIMYRGKIMETGSIESVFQTPKHPYTKLLLNSQPANTPTEARKRAPNPFELPTSSESPSPEGCPFYSRCPFRKKLCKTGPIPRKTDLLQTYDCIC
ncbi:oligopeptide/dipeptide ABC transporter ATP-binding protein [Chlamydiifrater phoenicopteri]|uniref:oligopeptide/dipeptide ABC transporter ATP-binding protein n=1 Tax=Chlamydiifrater phoenicopteri TaxID=2681469 RepID=UPI001BD05233|nr:oligopeptide/dipeptide ABC transporter ATP-binding protein [Chlamydiifrater phoenicopteri]